MKNAVDEAVDRCAVVLNLRDSIEDERLKAEQATDEKQKRVHTSKGLCKTKALFILTASQDYTTFGDISSSLSSKHFYNPRKLIPCSLLRPSRSSSRTGRV